ncbi:DUF488 domain-containing protein [Pontibacter burrus]|uniref:DUF488 domain-containing protein n=1 Tax=Pontibacter burrus TaxID=2704466 RepID=A0A6B3LNG6_9BACT|nr:DUF488 domain-containing protein [Pontibacter burrus]NEM98452.1 DUF488 domain-containing protein [Pontibacter burrus]
MTAQQTIWTFGHSTRSPEEVIQALQSFGIEVLADVRRYPGSRKYPHFNAEALEEYLPAAGINYTPFTALGGRRKPRPDSHNTIWRSESFRGYADYSETAEFRNALEALKDLAQEKRTAYMCSEAVWWRCHRAIISDCLKEEGWLVMHIMKEEVATEHPYTAAYLQQHGMEKK